MNGTTRLPRAILLLTWLAAVSSLAALSKRYNGASNHFAGIADDQEQTISFATPVEVVRYGFVAGQEVEAGDEIVEVRQSELAAELQVLQERIHALRYGNRENRASMEAEIVQERAQLQATLAELDSRMRTLRAREGAAQIVLQGLGPRLDDNSETALERELDGLAVRRQALIRAASSRVADLESRLAASERPVDAQIAELDERRNNLQRRRAELTVAAKFSGRVGSVLFKVGDTVPPFAPIVTLHGARPTFVRGYIHENVVNDVQLEQTVWVRSANAAHRDTWHAGVVESLGSRIVEFPPRLKINPLAQAWGREVVIRLGDDHALLLGEKVNIQRQRPGTVLGKLKTTLAALRP